MRKLEINATKKKDRGVHSKHVDFKYNPHYHILIQGMGNAFALKRMWLKKFPDAHKCAQDISPTTYDYRERQGSVLTELLKYLSKPTVDGEGLFGTKAFNKARAFIYDKLIGRRTIISYGTIKQAPALVADVMAGDGNVG